MAAGTVKPTKPIILCNFEVSPVEMDHWIIPFNSSMLYSYMGKPKKTNKMASCWPKNQSPKPDCTSTELMRVGFVVEIKIKFF